MQLTDTHCHIHFADFRQAISEVLGRADKAGVRNMMCVGVNLEDSRQAIDFVKDRPGMWATAGIHPHDAKDFTPEVKNSLRELLNMSRVVAAGEMGLDYYRLISTKVQQQNALRQQAEVGLDAGLPFVFHVRDAWADFWEIFDDNKGIKGVLHSFTGGPKQLEAALSRGLYIALNGIVTFTRDQALLEAAKKIPANRLLLETDAPFLLPAGSANKTCEPSDVRLTAEFLADLRGESLEELAAATTKNASAIFGLENR